MRTVFTVFVSSTSEDLEPYRRAAKDVILDLHWHPEMMEHFGADARAGTVEACKQRVAQSDLVLAILGWRLGWVPGLGVGGDGKKSITQIEIETAKALNKPIVFLLAEKDWPGHLWEETTARRKQMAAFRSGIDRLAIFFSWEPVEVGKTETLPRFRAKVQRELQRNGPPTAIAMGGDSPPAPKYPSEQVRLWSEALTEAHERERTIVVAGGDPTAIREKILDLRRKLREGGRLKAGDLLAGRLQLIEALGKGGFATVWKAFDLERRALVAVKVLHGQYADDRTRLERFFRGARKMAELQHQGIVRVIEEEVDDGGFHFFVMEFLEGGDLHQAVLGQRLPEERIGPLLRELADALIYAHSRGVIHRDVKPANILLDREGHPKLTDFDLVLAANSTGGTRTGAALGTFLYASPECMAAPHTAGVAADVYSLAMTAAFCFYGRDLPYDVLRRSKAFLGQLPCPPAVRAALRKGAAWEAADRFPSVAAFAEAIERGLLAPAEIEKSAPRQRRPAVKSQPSALGMFLLPYLEREILNLPETDRSAAVLAAVEHALPLAADDLRTLGIVAWALDYFPGRSDRAGDREKAASLRERAFAPLRERRPPPLMPGRNDPSWASIPGGSFQMGSPEGIGHSTERPAHRVVVSPFRLGIYPVTVDEYSRLTGKGGTAEDLPATSVDWYSAYAYAAWLGGRLPTEAEWEYAARGGTPYEYADREGRKTTLEKVGWFSGHAKSRVQPVGGLEPSPWGLYDMIGNVCEWVADRYGPYSAAPQSDPWGPPSGGKRVVRGGSAWSDAGSARAAYRLGRNPGIVSVDRGFRVVLPAGPELKSRLVIDLAPSGTSDNKPSPSVSVTPNLAGSVQYEPKTASVEPSEKVQITEITVSFSFKEQGKTSVSLTFPDGAESHKTTFSFDTTIFLRNLYHEWFKTFTAGHSGHEFLDRLKGTGDLLFRRTFGESANRLRILLLENEARVANGKPGVLRLRFCFTQPSKNAIFGTTLPWELLADPQRPGFLARNRHNSIVRSLSNSRPVRPISVHGPLKVLLAISEPKEASPLGWREEVNRIKSALLRRSDTHVEVMEGASFQETYWRLSQGFHVFHFIGHGTGASDTDSARILFEINGQREAVSPSDLAERLGSIPTLPLAVITSCGGLEEGNPLGNVAALLSSYGIPAVIAMQAAVTDSAAIDFSGGFYRGLAEGLSIEASVSEGRGAIKMASPEWATPVLYLAGASSDLFRFEGTS